MSQPSSIHNTIRDILPSKHSSASVPSLLHHHDLPHSPSLTSLVQSVRDMPLYPPTLVQEPGVYDLPSPSDIIIAVMGPTGAGKSTFINKATGFDGTKIGHDLESCTHQIQIVRCFDAQQNRQIVFVDTPGFDDTNISDLTILQLIADWLKVTYERDIRLSGLLFFHRISDNRMGGSPIKCLKMFQNLCGDEALKNVVLVTTMWDLVSGEEGNNRETELSTTYWDTMIELGCHTSRFYNDKESAWDIVSQFQDARCAVLLQEELVDLHLELTETSAGRILFSFLIEFIRRIKEFLAQIEAKLKHNKYSANRVSFEQEKANAVATLRIAKVQRRRYSVSSSVFRRFNGPRPLGPSIPVNARQTLVSATPSSSPSPDNSPNTASRSEATPVVETRRANTSVPLTSSPIEFFSPPPSPADATGHGRTSTVLQGTITALRLVQQIVGLAPISGLQCLVGLVLNISETVNNMHAAEDALVELVRKAGSFMVTLVEHNSFPDSDSMTLAIEGLTKEMNRILEVVTRISSQRTPTRLLLSAFDKEAINECNRQMALACGIFGIQIALITQKAITRIEAKLNIQLALNTPQESNKQTTTAQRAMTC